MVIQSADNIGEVRTVDIGWGTYEWFYSISRDKLPEAMRKARAYSITRFSKSSGKQIGYAVYVVKENVPEEFLIPVVAHEFHEAHVHNHLDAWRLELIHAWRLGKQPFFEKYLNWRLRDDTKDELRNNWPAFRCTLAATFSRDLISIIENKVFT